MDLDQSGVLTVGLLVPCLITPCLSLPPGVVSHRSSLAPQGHYIRAVPMKHMVNKAYTRWVAANLISGHLVHAGNHRHPIGFESLFDQYFHSLLTCDFLFAREHTGEAR